MNLLKITINIPSLMNIINETDKLIYLAIFILKITTKPP